VRLHNSLSGRVEEFVPLREGKVGMYNCGPTVYKRQHIGNFRAFVLADLLRRTFEFLGYAVTQVMNVTDVGHLTEDDVADAKGEDKLQKEAERRATDPWQIAREEERHFHQDLKRLHILPAHEYPRATEHIAEMIAMIQALVANGHAYVAGGNVYFSIQSFPAYGALSGNTPARLEAGKGGRVEERTEKRSPFDFALWKHDEKHLMQWDSPWGRGYPGWHIECSSMSRRYLGDTLDIHTGGPDNKFPHHECEIAQSESVTGKPFVRYWVHCGWLEIGGEKMSKSKGKLFTIPELLEMGYTGRDLRLFLIKQHYRAPLPFQLELLDEAKRVRARFENFLHHQLADRPEGEVRTGFKEAVDGARREFKAALEDDLNTSRALAAIHEFMSTVNRLEPSKEEAELAHGFMAEANRVLAVWDEAPRPSLDADVEKLIADRETARKQKDFTKADAIRKQLDAKGIELLDTPQGTRWRRRGGEG